MNPQQKKTLENLIETAAPPKCPIDGTPLRKVAIEDELAGDSIKWLTAWYCPKRHPWNPK